MSILPTYIFIISMFLAEIPLFILAWHLLNKALIIEKSDVDTLGKVIFYVTVSKILFYTAQIITVLLGVSGYGYEARIPIILLVDGSLMLITIVNWYAFFAVKKIVSHV